MDALVFMSNLLNLLYINVLYLLIIKIFSKVQFQRNALIHSLNDCGNWNEFEFMLDGSIYEVAKKVHHNP